ncbi:MAG: diaminopimelate epimerase [Bacteroidia bacterium]|nr:diaminopimelate epimerase [Bacteroidia bacterium]
MMIEFEKYHGTGNDFILVDNRSGQFKNWSNALIKQLCDRHFGIGADGLILLEEHPDLDYRMVYFNSDGNESTMCGNGGRCLAHFAKALGIIETAGSFEAIDGIHAVEFRDGLVRLGMNHVDDIDFLEDTVILNTGSPHVVTMADNVDMLDVQEAGERIRYSDTFKEEGINVNFVEQQNDVFNVRTYERGVEAETLSCGTGVTAVAIAMHAMGRTVKQLVDIITPGGELQVEFEKTESGYGNIHLIGPAMPVFKGTIVCKP